MKPLRGLAVAALLSLTGCSGDADEITANTTSMSSQPDASSDAADDTSSAPQGNVVETSLDRFWNSLTLYGKHQACDEYNADPDAAEADIATRFSNELGFNVQNDPPDEIAETIGNFFLTQCDDF